MEKTKCGDFMLRKWNVVLFLLGGVTYGLIEIMWRQHTHWSMIILGGLCFSILCNLFTKMDNYSLLEKCVVGALVITALEFITGCIVNLTLDMAVWNYSRVPFNLLGQVCIVYSVLWGFLCIPIYYISKYLEKIKRRH